MSRRIAIAGLCTLMLAAGLGIVRSVPASAAAGDISGTVFDDVNANGTDDGEAGVAGVVATAFEASGIAAGSATTDSNGDYVISGLIDGVPYRIEFSDTPSGYVDGPLGADSESSVTFASPESSGVDYGVHVPVVCPTEPPANALLRTYNAAVTCTVRTAAGQPKDTFALIDVTNAVPASGRVDQTASTPVFHNPDWTITQLGNVFGIAIDSRTGNMFTAASSNYGSGLFNQPALTQYGAIGGGADDLGAAGTVYRLDAVTGTPTVFVQLPQQSTTITHYDCETLTPRNRTTGVGLGNLVYDEANNQIFVSNWEDGHIYRLDMSGNILDAYDPDVSDDGTAGFANGRVPFAVELSDDSSRLFFGTVYGREVWSIDLTGAGGFQGASSLNGAGVAIFENAASESLNITLTQSEAVTASWLTGAQIDQFVADLDVLPGGDMLAGMRVGCGGSPHTSYNHYGETRQLSANGSGIYISAAPMLDISVFGQAAQEDSYGGVSHYVRPNGDVDYVVVSADILSEAGPHGLAVFPEANSTDSPISPLGAIDYGTGNDPKGIGGDVEVLNLAVCVPSQLEVGNYVWLDLDGNGVQDPSELPLVGVTVTLFAADGTTVLATTITDSDGEYSFGFADGVAPSTSYVLGFDVATNTTPLPAGFSNVDLFDTLADSGAGANPDVNDSDITAGTIAVTTGGAGENDHTLDAGFTLPYDLALTKVYTSDTSIDGNLTDGVVEPGDDVTFTVTVFNQGATTAATFEVTDYLPAGFVLNDSAWTDNGDGTAAISAGPLAPGSSVDLTITLSAAVGVAAGAHVNWAEISSDDGVDVDSTPNTNRADDAQPAGPGAPTDDVIDNTGGDEDDHDPAGIVVNVYDLALTKVYTSDTSIDGNGADGVVQIGDDVTFTVTVFNQGSVTASTFDLIDYMPVGFVLNDSAWTDLSGGVASISVGPLPAGVSLDVPITLTAVTAGAGAHVNWAEISSDDGVDVDSTPNTNPLDDAQPAGPGAPTDDVIDNTGGDEDDHDPAGITVDAYDLALRKVYTSDTFGLPSDGIMANAADVTFTITVFNQGTVDAATFTVTDYLPTGFVLNDAAWTDNGDGTASIVAGPLGAGSNVDIPITVTAVAVSDGGHVNWAEISSDDGLDVDSTPNADQTDDAQPAGPGTPTDDVIDNTGGDEDDHDPAGVTVVTYDLALTKTYTSDTSVDGNSTDGVIQLGDDVTFTITVFNQGTLDANNFTVTDYLPAGFVLNDAAWTDNGDGTAAIAVGPLTTTSTLNIPITFTAAAPGTGLQVNWAEISADDGVDLDSTPNAVQADDAQPSGPGAPTDDVVDNTGGDEDDHDPAGVTVDSYDLALRKVYTSDTSVDGNSTDGVIQLGDDVTFMVTVFNQGTVDAATFTVTDYLPTGFVLNDSAWSDNGDGTASITAGPLSAGTSVDIPITVSAATAALGDHANWAEISADDGVDSDSTPNTDPADDSQPVGPGAPTDDVVDNSGGDEDDHDPAGITVASYDLALIKVYTSDSFAAPTDGVMINGSDATFTITVFNQGTIDAGSFTVTDYLPAGFVLNDAAWIDNGDGTASIAVGPLTAGSSLDIPITVQASGAALGSHVNWAEIRSDDGVDIDSVPNSNPLDDSQPSGPGAPTDDVVDNSGGDEDDHDPAGITIANYDLALIKTYTSDTSLDGNSTDGEVQLGDDVTFTITVFNQGTIDANTFTVTDYLPVGFVLNDSAWTDNGDGTASITAGPLAAGSSVDVAITVSAVTAALGAQVNWAEISADDGFDIDSTPNADPADDSQPAGPGAPTDDVIDNTAGDEDDHDPAGVTVASYDLALIKVYTSDTSLDGNSTDGAIQAGDDVTFTVTVFNQGTSTANNITVTDYLPAGFVLNDAAWTDNGDGTASIAIGLLSGGASVDIAITLTATTAPTGDHVNWAEISADDGVDTDSTPNGVQGDDAQPAGPGAPTDDVVDNTGGDEDDHDPAGVTVASYDLALTKVYTSDTSLDGNSADGVIQPGDDVTFTVTVFNQGTVDAASFTVTDYLPAGFVLNDAAWTDNGDGTASIVLGPLTSGSNVDVAISVTASAPSAGTQVNWAEISADDGFDADSTPNTDSADDSQPVGPGAPTDDVVDNSGGDEDDHDPAGVTVVSYDLALTKVYTSDTSLDGNNTDGVIQAGDDVTFTVTVFNQGTVDAASFTVTDYLPAGFVLNDSAWTDNGDGTASITAGPLSAGSSVDIAITVSAVTAALGAQVNWAEISADDGFDIDSTPNGVQGDDAQPAGPGAPTDNVVDNTGGDEDDHDPAGVTVASYDLALTKLYSSDTSLDGNSTDGVVQLGDDVTFTVTVFNQGTVDANSFTVTDYLPTGFVLNDSAWTDNGDGTASIAAGPLVAGSSVDISITLAASSASPGDHANWAEISVDDGVDSDSTPNTDPADDTQPAGPGAPTDDVVDNTGGDEDDHDPAGVTVEAYDLALIKVYTSDTSLDGNNTDGVIQVGDDVTFTVTVFNQGTVDAASFAVTDYLPTGFVLNDAAWTDNGDGTAAITAGPLSVGSSVDLAITLTATTPLTGAHVNWAEISVDDGFDADSTPNTDPGDDAQPVGPGSPTDDVVDNSGGDEDDHDPAGITVERYDLALAKIYTSDTFGAPTDGVIQVGADVTFTITVTNEGTLAATNIEVVDYLPAGFVLNDSAWTDNGDGTASIAAGPIGSGASIDIDITMTALTTGAGNLVNWAEISVDDGFDDDSTPNTDPDDDPPGEDDLDSALVTVDAFDLALAKTYLSDTSADGNSADGLIEQGDDVTFEITIYNQGTAVAGSYDVIDYLPAGFVLNDAAWTDNGNSTASISAGPLAAATTDVLTITLTAAIAPNGQHVNRAEISVDDGLDIDSTPNTDPDDDAQPANPGDPTDDVIDNSGGDEDDHDIASVAVRYYDLALAKVYTSDTYDDPTDGVIANGSDATFTITVTNEGTIDATTIELVDYVPAGFVLNDPAWTDNGDSTASINVGPIAAGDSLDVPITITAVSASVGPIVNWAEISVDDGNDIDSTPNTTQSDDPADDDLDSAPLTMVTTFDLALRKTVDAGATSFPIVPGQDVTFLLTVFNQGTATAGNITVVDYIDAAMWEAFDTAANPSGTTSGDAALSYSWALSGGDAVVSLVGELVAGESLTIPVTLTIAAGADLAALVNVAEISAADPLNPDGSTIIGVVDQDSTPDATDGDPLVDDVIDNSGGDEDDHDIATVEPPLYSLGNQVWLDANNDGARDATESPLVGVVLHLFADSDADGTPDDTNGDGVIDVTDSVGSQTTDVDGLYLFEDIDGGDYIVGIPPSQWADGAPLRGLLSSDPTGTAGVDGDSDDNGSDCLCSDGYVFSNATTLGDGEPIAEDVDNDPSTPDANSNLTVDFGFWMPEFDLALRKQLAAGTPTTVAIGSAVTFTITVFNQGTVAANDIEIVDYVPVGLTLNDNDWALSSGGDALIRLAGVTLQPGASTTVDITFIVNASVQQNQVVNVAEIADSTAVDVLGTALEMPNGDPIVDVDSVADLTDDETPVDDEIANLNGDEDDHDLALLSITARPTPPRLALTGSDGFPRLFGGVAALLAGLMVLSFIRWQRREYPGSLLSDRRQLDKLHF